MNDLTPYVEKGMSGSEIAREFQKTITTIYRWADKQGLGNKLRENGREKQGGVVDSILLEEVRKLILSGESAVGIGCAIGKTNSTIRNYAKLLGEDYYSALRENGNRAKSNPKVTEEDIARMVALSDKGKGLDLIGKELGFDGSTVRRYLIRELGEEGYAKRHSVDKYTSYWSGRYYRNDRGDILQSSLEEIVADLLYEWKLRYSTHNRLKLGEKVYFPDFKLLDFELFIEVFGMSDLRFYQEKMDEKKRDFALHSVKCVYLYKTDFKNIEEKLRRELRSYIV